MTTPHDELRLLPWSGPDGKPCFLSADDNTGYLSRLADNTESLQLSLASKLLDHAPEVLADEEADPDELRLLAADLTGALRDAVRVASSRGHRLAIPAPFAGEERTEAPRQPVAPD
ncbi:hypothetical protein GCM10010371_60500 [Streptomyces subrutilus]|uniref:Uncharacterized protein n=1 Tax=Streptomyces subrutilus TaxID=36818 RepID=A0A918RB97_9ACTN|nr:hypothetical protein [Streptomyces subrutilus]GGZ92621.1 hypothetical protein GCM10010371_60500 [Streptomyces subrutilus]